MSGPAAPRRPRPGSSSLEALPSTGEICALTLDPQLKVIDASPGCRHLFQVEPQALLGRRASELLDPLAQLAPMSEGSLEVFARGGGRPRRVRLFWSTRGPSVELLLLDLERAASGPFAQAAALSRFASMITHEVRNPLSSVKMVIQTLARHGPLDERAQRRLEIAAREVRTIERILTALSELSCDTGRERAEAELAPLLQEALQLSELDVAERGLTVSVELAARLPPLWCDAARIRMALAHLLAYASRALAVGELAIGAEAEGEMVRLTVAGPSAGTSAPPSSSNISLAMVDKIARDHGGELSVEESPRTCAWSLTLPARPRGG